MAERKNKSLMQSLGEFVGHIVKAVKADPGKKRTVIKKTTEEEQRGNLTLRRTTIEEIEVHDPKDPNG